MNPADRLGYLGGSDAAVVLGISPWKTRYRLWCEKTGAEPAPDLSGIDYIYFGTLLEPLVAKEFQRRLGKKVREMRKLTKHPKYPFIAGHVDRDVLNEDALLECKTSNAFDFSLWGKDSGSSDILSIPPYYLPQVDHYMLVTDRSLAYVAVLIGGNDFRWYIIKRDAKREAVLLQSLIDFQKLIETDDPPEIASEKDAKHRWKTTVADTAEPVDLAMRQKVLRLDVVATQRRALEKEEETLRDVIIPTFKDREILSHDGEAIARLTSYPRAYFDKDAFETKHPKIAKRFTTDRQTKRLKILI